jgi:hypothetical protein
MTPTDSAATKAGRARVFLGDGPESGIGHEGLRGDITLDALGVHFDASQVEWLTDGDTEWEAPDPAALPLTIPAARVHSIEWLPGLEPE